MQSDASLAFANISIAVYMSSNYRQGLKTVFLSNFCFNAENVEGLNEEQLLLLVWICCSCSNISIL